MPVDDAVDAWYAMHEEHQLEIQIAMTMSLRDFCQMLLQKRYLGRVVAAAKNMDVADKMPCHGERA